VFSTCAVAVRGCQQLCQRLTFLAMSCTFRFSLIYGESANHDHLLGFPVTYYMFRDVGAAPNAALAPTIPVSVYSMFELSFALVGPAIITAELSGKPCQCVLWLQ
jgi:ammonia channel protein AmtB